MWPQVAQVWMAGAANVLVVVMVRVPPRLIDPSLLPLSRKGSVYCCGPAAGLDDPGAWRGRSN
jgi:hypothetical protein